MAAVRLFLRNEKEVGKDQTGGSCVRLFKITSERDEEEQV